MPSDGRAPNPPASDSASPPASPPAASQSPSPEGFSGRLAVALLAGIFVFYLWNAWQRDFWAPEEPDFAAAAKEMGASGDWLQPTIAGRPYLEKPPLVYWCSLVFERLLGFEPRLAYRIAPALAATLGLWLVYVLGRRLFDHRRATLAVAIQGTSFLYHRAASWLLTDMLFAAALTLAMTGAAEALLAPPAQLRRGRRLLAAGLAFATLSKSLPLALVLVGAPLLVFCFLEFGVAGAGRALRTLQPGRALALALLAAAPWYGAMLWQNGWSFIEEHFLEHHLGRLADAESHRRGLGHYLATLPVDFAPWSLFLPLWLFYGHTQKRRREVKLLFLWALAALILLSLVSSKQGKYLLPIWPALSLLVSAALLEDRSRRESLWELWLGPRVAAALPWLFFAAAAALAVGGGLVLLDWLPQRLRDAGLSELLERPGFGLKAFALSLLAAAGLAASASIQRRWLGEGRVRYPAMAAAGAVAWALWLSTWFYGDLNSIKSARRFCAAVEKLIQDRPLASYGQPRAAIVYYLGRPLRQSEVLAPLDPSGTTPENTRRLEDWLAAGPGRFLLIKEDDREDLESNFPFLAPLYREALAGKVGSRRRYLLLEALGKPGR